MTIHLSATMSIVTLLALTCISCSMVTVKKSQGSALITLPDDNHFKNSILALTLPDGTMHVVTGNEAKAQKIWQRATLVDSNMHRYASTANLYRAMRRLPITPPFQIVLTNYVCRHAPRENQPCTRITNEDGNAYWEKVVYNVRSEYQCFYDGSTNTYLSIWGTIGTVSRYRHPENCTNGLGAVYVTNRMGFYCGSH